MVAMQRVKFREPLHLKIEQLIFSFGGITPQMNHNRACVMHLLEANLL